jgi:uncharacterized protein YciI
MHFLLFYEKAPDYAERQKPLAAAHLEYLQGLVRQGHLILAGNLEDPADGSALLLYKADSSLAVEAFAAADPYVLGGVICRWYIRHWDTVLGKEAASPLP